MGPSSSLVCIVEGVNRLTDYVRAAMRKAQYEILEDGTYYGEIPAFSGVFANATTLEACRDQLQEVLEDWILLGYQLGHSLIVVDRLMLELNY